MTSAPSRISPTNPPTSVWIAIEMPPKGVRETSTSGEKTSSIWGMKENGCASSLTTVATVASILPASYGISRLLGLPVRLTSELTIVDVILMSTDGKAARYQKTSNYVVNAEYLDSYQEGVTATGQVGGFSSMLGTLVETTHEHGLFISRIDLFEPLSKGSRFQNVFTADLHDCFINDEEHWTQEIAFPTEHLTLRVHFPKGRPPKRVKCKVVEGVTNKQVRTDAKITELSGEQGIVWDIESPKPVVVNDDMHVEPGEHIALDLVEEPAELLRATTRHAFADNGSCLYVKGGKERSRIVPLIVVRAPLGLARSHRQERLRSIERLYLAHMGICG